MNHYCRTYILFSFLCLIAFSLNAQKWIKSYEAHEGNVVVDILPFNELQTVILINGTAPKLLFIQEDGEEVKNVSLSSYFTNVYAMTLTESEFIIVGSNGSSFNINSVITMLAHDGTLIWTEAYERGFLASVALKDDLILVGGNFDSAGSKSEQLFMAVNKVGDLIWKKTQIFTSNGYVGKILVEEDRVFLISSNTTVGVGFEGFYVGEFDLLTKGYLWVESYYTGYFYDIFEHNYDFPFGACISSDEIAIVFPGNQYGELSTFYRISKDGEFVDATQLFLTEGVHPHDIKPFENGDFLIVGSYYTATEINNVVERRDSKGQIVWQKRFGTGTLFSASINGNQVIIGGMAESYYNSNASQIPLIASITTDGVLFNSGVSISLKKDETNMCGLNEKVAVEENVKIFIKNKELIKNENDKYILDLPIGAYKITYKTPTFFDPCNWPSYIMVENEVHLEEIELITNINQCADLYIGVTKTELIKGQSNSLFLEYQNRGNKDIDDAYVILKLDNRLDLISTSIDYEFIDNNEFKLNIGTIPSGSNGRISISLQPHDKVSLFTNLNIEAEIFPHTNCLEEESYGDHFDIVSTCNEGKLTFKIVNRGEDMVNSESAVILIDGYDYDVINFVLDPGKSQSYSLDVDGQAGTIQIYKGENVIKSHSYEGCGTLSDGYSTVAIASQYNDNLDLPFVDNSVLEVRDHHTDSRLFQSNNGRGRYHVINSDFGQAQFIVRYPNDSAAPINNLKATIDLPTQALLNSVELMASSHDISAEVKNGKLIITSKESIASKSEFQCKYSLDFDASIQPNEFISSTLNLSSQDERIGIENLAYYNTTVDFSLETPSPFAEVNDGHIFGKNDGADFSSDLVVLPNGDKIAAGSGGENTVGYVLTLYKFDKYEQLKWTKEYKFDQASPLVRDVEVLNDGNIMIVGSLDDKHIYNNYLGDAISFLLVINSEGEEVHRERMILGEGAFIGSTLLGALAMDNGNILIIGNKYQTNTFKFFKMVLNPQYEQISIENIQPPSGYATTSYSEVVKNENCIALASFLNSIHQYEDSFIMFNQNGGVYNSNLFEFDTDEDGFSPYNSYVHQDGSVLSSGLYYDYENGEYVDAFYTIMELDKYQNFIRKFEVLPDAYYYSITAVMKNNSNYLVAGSFYLDTLSNRDAFLMELDSIGNVLWMVGEDMGAREESESIFIGEDGSVYATFQTQAADDFYNLQMGYLYGPKSTTSTKELHPENHKSSISVYPNPTKDRLYIEDSGVQYIKYQIISMTGKIQKSFKTSERCLDVSELSSGNYILILTNEEGVKKYANFVKI